MPRRERSGRHVARAGRVNNGPTVTAVNRRMPREGRGALARESSVSPQDTGACYGRRAAAAARLTAVRSPRGTAASVTQRTRLWENCAAVAGAVGPAARSPLGACRLDASAAREYPCPACWGRLGCGPTQPARALQPGKLRHPAL